jgi:hypothetical protein
VSYYVDGVRIIQGVNLSYCGDGVHILDYLNFFTDVHILEGLIMSYGVNGLCIVEGRNVSYCVDSVDIVESLNVFIMLMV